MPPPSILALSQAVPPHAFHQRETAERAINLLAIPPHKQEFVRRTFAHSCIDTRYSVLDDFCNSQEEWQFWGSDFPNKVPGMSQRNDRYKLEAPLLAEQAARACLTQWGGDVSRITHLISISCTGMMAPGIEYLLMERLGLSPTINRLGINFMGCFGAFKGLSAAQAFAQANPDARILVVCTELCTLHMQAAHSFDALLSNALFSDGASAALVGSHSSPWETPLWELHRTHSLGFKHSTDKMFWEASDTGFLIGLSHTVPVYIKRNIQTFVKGLLPDTVGYHQCNWALHPGGASILQAIEKSLNLVPEQTHSSWKILRDYGNMSSATFLFVLNDLTSRASSHSWAVGVGFGPGLSAEGMLLRRSPDVC